MAVALDQMSAMIRTLHVSISVVGWIWIRSLCRLERRVTPSFVLGARE